MKTTLKYTFGAILAFLVTTHVSLAADAWPTSTSGTQIGSGLATRNTTSNGFEASGLEYLDGYGYIAVGDDGDLAVLSTSGAVSQYWNTYQSISNDFEDVTVTNTSASDSKVYIGNEYSNKIEEFNISTGAKTGKSWTLSDLPVSGGSGFEALAYVPEEYAPASWGTAQSGGFFVAASQAENILHVYTFDRNSSSSVSDVATITLDQSYYDIGALQYNTSTELLYVVFDGADKLKEYSLVGVEVNSYQLPTYLQTVDGVNPYSDEGFVIVPNCSTGLAQVALAVDNISSRVTVYSNYPITCTETTPEVPVEEAPVEIDADGDGYNSDVDCNDADRAVYTNITYYRDADGDSYGSSTNTTSVCTNVVPTGYVTNYSDANDEDYDNDGVSYTVDCNDYDSRFSSTITYYRDADGDTLGDATNTTSICTNVVPTGYVTNSSDANDADYDNDGVSYDVDCNDADSAISSNRTYYRDADGDTMGDPNTTTSICDNNVPYGYVTNANDTDDTQAPVTEVIPSSPTNLAMERLALRKMRMSWNGSGNYYNVKLTDTTAGNTSTFTNITTTSKTVGKNYIFSRHIYTFSVQACNDLGCSAYANSTSFKAYSIKQWRRIQRLNKNR